MRGIPKKAIPVAEVRSLNKTIVSTRQRAVQHVHQHRRLKKGVIRKQLVITRANRRTFLAKISASRKPIPLKQYAAKWSGRGRNRRVVVNVSGQRQKLEHAFIIDQVAGRQVGHVFERKGSARLPIKKLFGPSLGSALVKTAVSEAVLVFAGQRWGEIFPRELEFAISKLPRK